MGSSRPDSGLYPADRLDLAAAAAAEAGLAALLLTPGPDLRYLTGYDAHQLERLTCLAVPAAGSDGGRPFLIFNAYCYVNIIAWLALSVVLWDLLEVRDMRTWIAWFGILFSAGAMRPSSGLEALAYSLRGMRPAR